MNYNLAKDELEKHIEPGKAKIYQNFFKTKPGEYGYGDIFIGVTVPNIRKVAKLFYDINLNDLKKLLASKIHEQRMLAIVILIKQYKKDSEKIYKFFIKNIKHVNNWDLVDISVHHIIGDFLLNKDKQILYDFANSKNLWKRRIAIISTFKFIKEEKFQDTIKISKILLNDKHDLIHKAVGWMLREIGKKNMTVLIEFLDKNYDKMPRTMLRYAIEKLNEKKRQHYLKK